MNTATQTSELITLYAQPYDICANGFYFHSMEDYQEKYDKNINQHGQPVEEYEIQFIDGSEWINGQEALDSVGLETFLDISETWDQSDIERLEMFIHFIGGHYGLYGKGEDEIKRMLEDTTAYVGANKKEVCDEIFENAYCDLERKLIDLGAYDYFDVESYVESMYLSNITGCHGRFNNQYVVFEYHR